MPYLLLSSRPSRIYYKCNRFTYDANSRQHDMESQYHCHSLHYPLFIDYLESSLVSDINARMFENKITLLDFNTWLEFCSVMIACRNCNTYAIKS